MKRFVAYLVYLFIAIAAGCEISIYGGDVLGLGGSLLAFMICLQVHSSVQHRRERIRHKTEIAQLETALRTTRTKLDDLSTMMDAKTSARNREIISQLMTLESMMREQAGKLSGKTPHTSHKGSRKEPKIAETTDMDILKAVKESLEQNRVDLMLQPIVRLPQRKLAFYEAFSRLRTADDTVIPTEHFIKAATKAGLMSTVDNLFLFHCVHVVRRLSKKHRNISVFCNISLDTISDTEFFPQFLEYIEQNRDLRHYIVFEFAQDTVLQSSRDVAANLLALDRMGFTLSLDHVTTLDVDYSRLRNLGFKYMKVHASTLLAGPETVGAPVVKEDFKSLLSRHGMELIAEKVEEEKTVVEMLDDGVDYAQGYLFGEPRMVRDEILHPARESGKPENPPAISPRSARNSTATAAAAPLRQAS